MTLRDASLRLKLPIKLTYDYLHGDGGEEVQARYEAVCKFRAHEAIDEVIPLADSLDDKPSQNQVLAKKLQIETRFRAAEKLDLDRWGERKDGGRVVSPVVIQIANLRGASLEVKTSAALPEPDPNEKEAT